MKKPKNARASNRKLHQRPHVLDVTLTQHKERARRTRAAFRRVFLFLLVVGVLAGGYLGGREGLRRVLWENPDYLVHEVVFRTDGTLLRDDVIGHSGIVEGRNIFLLDLAAARRRIAGLPQVESATVERHLPNSVTVTVTERKPIAWVMQRPDEDPTQSARACLIDARGIPMKPRSRLLQFMHLPIICGFPVENLADGQRVMHYEIAAALELIRMNEGNTRWLIRTIDVQSGYSLLATDVRRIEILFHLDNLEGQLNRLHQLFTLLGSERQKELKRVNLFGQRNTYATFRPPADPEAETSEIMPASNPHGAPAKPAPPAKGLPPPKAAPTPKKSGSPAAKTPSKLTPTPARTPSSIDKLKRPFNSNG